LGIQESCHQQKAIALKRINFTTKEKKNPTTVDTAVILIARPKTKKNALTRF